MKKELGKTIAARRKALGRTQAWLAERLDITPSNVSKYENGVQAPDFDRLVLLSGCLEIPMSELFRHAELGGVEDGPDIRGSVPLISEVQAGNWKEVIDNLQPGEGVRIPTTYKAQKHTYALRVRGDSMEPKFPEGAIIIVEPEEAPNPGSYVIVRVNGDNSATFKQLVQDGDRQYLKPLNPRYPIMELKEDAVFCGVVKRMEMDV